MLGAPRVPGTPRPPRRVAVDPRPAPAVPRGGLGVWSRDVFLEAVAGGLSTKDVSVVLVGEGCDQQCFCFVRRYDVQCW